MKIHVHRNVKNQRFSWEGYQKLKVRALKNHKKISKKLCKILSVFSFFLWIFGGCWPYVGPQNPPKIHKKSIQKSLQKMMIFLIDFMLIYVDFCWILGFKLGAKRGGLEQGRRHFFRSWGQDGPKSPQEAPKTPPRGSQEPPRASKIFPTAFKMLPRGPKRLPRGPKRLPEGSQQDFSNW